MAASILDEAKADVERITAEKAAIDLRILPLLTKVERDIRLNLRPPFNRDTTKTLSGFLLALLAYVIEDVIEAPNSVERPVTAANELERLKKEGADILDQIEPYAMLADLHFGQGEGRPERVWDELSKEIDDLAARAKALKERILKYLNDFYNCLTEVGI